MPYVSVNVAPPTPAEHELIANLLEEALRLLECDTSGARRRIEGAQALARPEGGSGHSKRGLLAGWQLHRAEAYIRDHLDSHLRLEAVAKAVNLSPSYFSRAFKVSKGISYSEFVLACRITLAKKLLLTTDMSIARIALECGMADQSHLTRIFNRTVGASPCAWRRQRTEGPFEAGNREKGI